MVLKGPSSTVVLTFSLPTNGPLLVSAIGSTCPVEANDKLYFNPAKLACRNSRPEAVNNATNTPCPMAIFRAM